MRGLIAGHFTTGGIKNQQEKTIGKANEGGGAPCPWTKFARDDSEVEF
jgi:hypothetical protein